MRPECADGQEEGLVVASPEKALRPFNGLYISPFGIGLCHRTPVVFVVIRR
ncbi:MAG: hypothetical protein HN368_07105 [Spirochaetales bacterium]|nr:hypothetical protein [Spirochaetales bacterium]